MQGRIVMTSILLHLKLPSFETVIHNATVTAWAHRQRLLTNNGAIQYLNQRWFFIVNFLSLYVYVCICVCVLWFFDVSCPLFGLIISGGFRKPGLSDNWENMLDTEIYFVHLTMTAVGRPNLDFRTLWQESRTVLCFRGKTTALKLPEIHFNLI